jgi:hypothetical protein
MSATYIPSIYIKDGADNVGSVNISKCSSLVPLGAVTKIELLLSNDSTISSDTYPDVFDWTTSPGVVFVSPGSVTSLLDDGTNNASMFVYDGLNVNGAWVGDIRLLN